MLNYINNNLKIFIICLLLTKFVKCLHREKRTLTHPPPRSRVQVIYGIGLPVALEDISVTMGYVIKANYFLPTNAANFTNPSNLITRKRRNTHDRWNFYTLLSNFLHRYGGKSCVLKTICEFAEQKVDKNNGLFEEIFYILFRPSTTAEMLSNTMDREYLIAEKIGLSGNDGCKSLYSKCSINLIDYFLV